MRPVDTCCGVIAVRYVVAVPTCTVAFIAKNVRSQRSRRTCHIETGCVLFLLHPPPRSHRGKLIGAFSLYTLKKRVPVDPLFLSGRSRGTGGVSTRSQARWDVRPGPLVPACLPSPLLWLVLSPVHNDNELQFVDDMIPTRKQLASSQSAMLSHAPLLGPRMYTQG